MYQENNNLRTLDKMVGKYRQSLIEQTVLFISIIKWATLAIMVGIIVGLATTVFLKLLGLCSAAIQAYHGYYLFLPLILFLSALMVHYLAPDAAGHGTEKVIESVHKNWGNINIKVVPVKLIATVITLAGGGSAGKEGPCAQIGAGLASSLANLMHMSKEDRKRLVICGISAGFATVFGTPVAGALFAVEVLVLGRIMQEMLFPSLVAAVVGCQVTHYFGIVYFHHQVSVKPFSQVLFLKLIAAGIIFGLVALVLIEVLKMIDGIAKKINIWKPAKGILGGLVLILLTLVSSPIYLGLGTTTITNAINGSSIPPFAFLWKTIFTAITLGFGGSGGILTPVFFIGATSGNALGNLLGLSPGAMAAIGMVALLSGAANTPVAASVMAIEMFGPQIGVYAAVVCVISYIASGHRSVYSSQVLGVTKSASLQVPLMQSIGEIDKVRLESQPGKIIYVWRRLHNKKWVKADTVHGISAWITKRKATLHTLRESKKKQESIHTR